MTKPASECFLTNFKNTFMDKSPDKKAATTPVTTASGESESGVLPELPRGCTAQKIEVLTNGYCISADMQQKVQRYQIQCRLLYLKEF